MKGSWAPLVQTLNIVALRCSLNETPDMVLQTLRGSAAGLLLQRLKKQFFKKGIDKNFIGINP